MTRNTPPVHHLLRTILERPELAAYIKHIDFRSNSMHRIERKPALKARKRDIDYIVNFVKDSNLPMRHFIVNEVRHKNGGWYFILSSHQI
jgi:hypothetical protein